MAEASKGSVLLQGVENALLEEKKFKIKVEVEYYEDANFKSCFGMIEVKFLEGKIWFKNKIEPGGDVSEFENTVVINNDEVYQYKAESAKANIYNMKDATRRAIFAFDPRLLAITAVPQIDSTIQAKLDYGKYQEEKAEKVDYNGLSVWNVVFKNELGTVSFWIEEPTFKVHKFTYDATNMKIMVVSKYDNPKFGIFPSSVEAEMYQYGQKIIGRKFKIKEIELNGLIGDEAFSLSSLNMPLNTRVSDNRTSHLAGYWDGKELSKNPVRYSRDPAELERHKRTSPLGNTVRYILMGVGAILIGCGIYRMIVKKDKTIAA